MVTGPTTQAEVIMTSMFPIYPSTRRSMIHVIVNTLKFNQSCCKVEEGWQRDRDVVILTVISVWRTALALHHRLGAYLM